MRRILLIAIGFLYLLSIPWYREGGSESELLLGLPDWVATAILCYFAVAILNAMAWLWTEVPEDPEPEDASGSAGARGDADRQEAGPSR